MKPEQQTIPPKEGKLSSISCNIVLFVGYCPLFENAVALTGIGPYKAAASI